MICRKLCAVFVPFDEKAVLALMGLGYDRREAENAVKRATSPDMTTEQIVYAVLHG